MLIPLLFNAASHAFFLQMTRTHVQRPAESAAAAVDSEGVFHEAMPRLLELLDQCFSDRPAHTLPFALPAAGQTEVIEGLCIRAEPLSDLRCVFIWVVNHLYRVYRKLGVFSRSALAARVYPGLK